MNQGKGDETVEREGKIRGLRGRRRRGGRGKEEWGRGDGEGVKVKTKERKGGEAYGRG